MAQWSSRQCISATHSSSPRHALPSGGMAQVPPTQTDGAAQRSSGHGSPAVGSAPHAPSRHERVEAHGRAASHGSPAPPSATQVPPTHWSPTRHAHAGAALAAQPRGALEGPAARGAFGQRCAAGPLHAAPPDRAVLGALARLPVDRERPAHPRVLVAPQPGAAEQRAPLTFERQRAADAPAEASPARAPAELGRARLADRHREERDPAGPVDLDVVALRRRLELGEVGPRELTLRHDARVDECRVRGQTASPVTLHAAVHVEPLGGRDHVAPARGRAPADQLPERPAHVVPQVADLGLWLGHVALASARHTNAARATARCMPDTLGDRARRDLPVRAARPGKPMDPGDRHP